MTENQDNGRLLEEFNRIISQVKSIEFFNKKKLNKN